MVHGCMPLADEQVSGKGRLGCVVAGASATTNYSVSSIAAYFFRALRVFCPSLRAWP